MFERSVGTVWVCGTPCCQQDITARKRPTSYGNSNSVQVFSAYTFAAKRAPDWPGGQAGPQKGGVELECGIAKASGQGFFFYRMCSCTPLVHMSSLCYCVLTQYVCKTSASHPGDTPQAETRLSFLLTTVQKYRVHLKF